jgi:hypothetical protein
MAAARAVVLLAAMTMSGASCAHETPPVELLQAGTWGSDNARVTFTDSTATLQIANGNQCYGARADARQPIPNHAFMVAATYTQFTGVYPGYVQRAAQMSGAIAGNRITVSIVDAGTGQLAAGPFDLTYGVNPQWNQCLYP